jgi:hypothetical protein
MICETCGGKQFVNADGSPNNAFEGCDSDSVKPCPSCTVRRDWFNVGKQAGYSGTPQADAKIVNAIASMKWETLEPGKQFPMMPAMGISEVIKQCRVPKASHVAISNHLAPYGFYGIRGHYTNGDAEVYVIDSGDCITPVCADFHPVA